MSQQKRMEIRSVALGIRRVCTALHVLCTSEVLTQLPGEVLEHRHRTVVHHKMFFFVLIDDRDVGNRPTVHRRRVVLDDDVPSVLTDVDEVLEASSCFEQFL
ncbi:hypothetical protein RPQ02_38960 [Streptomyces sp. AM2-3-1]|uniref:hypothetical protein n=1 Tax=Streptomyces sp. AM2-3-1 TaxID=3075824 RepID=UPI0028C42262|nr:hypothetical protein [Streptomyces sp. AM2-3-1]WNO69349.1 hypothetical protein RPQ02_38960 [Streptomyces sp. AM2-3-1]